LWPHDKQFPSFDHRAERWNSDELRSRITQLNAVRTLLSSALPSLRAIALRFALSNQRLSAVVLGPRNILQLDQLVREAGAEPPYLDERRLSELRERLVTVGVYL
jgi:aryl-alcohol dehydrogenase-like predicted oxidoreductase